MNFRALQKNQSESWKSSGKSWKFVSEKGYEPSLLVFAYVWLDMFSNHQQRLIFTGLYCVNEKQHGGRRIHD